MAVRSAATDPTPSRRATPACNGPRRRASQVDCGYWPLYRYNPASIAAGDNAFSLDSKRIKSSLATYLQNENRYASLRRTNVERADYLQGEFEASTVKRMETNRRHATPHSPYLTPHIPHIYR